MLPTRDDALIRLVAALAEIYQPIFGHPELSTAARRDCEDRWFHISRIHRLLESMLGRPPRVLDLGCAQGFFSFRLAELGATVLGIDFQPANIVVCNALAASHPDLNVRFELGWIEEAIARLGHDQYDVVLGLSVFHHAVHRTGATAVTNMLSALAEKTCAGIFEMALAHEPLEWSCSQPQDPRQLLQGFAFVHELARSATHLSAIARPLYVASNRCWFLGGTAAAFDTWQAESHGLAGGASHGTRRYYFGNGLVAKVFDLRFAGCLEANVREHDNEVAFLRAPPPYFPAPRLLAHGRGEHEAWLVRECQPGELLSHHIRSGKPYDTRTIILDVLEQLAALQTVGLFHDDLRAWNVLIGADGHARVIDYGAISMAGHDCAWPHNLFLAFMIFMHEIITANISKPDPLRLPLLNPAQLPEPYRSAMWDLLERPPHTWSFAWLRDRLAQPWQDGSEDSKATRAGFALVFEALQVSTLVYRGITRQVFERAREAAESACSATIKTGADRDGG